MFQTVLGSHNKEEALKQLIRSKGLISGFFAKNHADNAAINDFPIYVLKTLLDSFCRAILRKDRCVTSRQMTVEVLVTPNKQVLGDRMRYIYQESTSNRVKIEFYAADTAEYFFGANGKEYLESAASHELEHHADRKTIDRMLAMNNRVRDLQRKDKISSNGVLAIYAFRTLRIEGLARFSEHVKEMRLMLNFLEARKFLDCLQIIANDKDLLLPKVTEVVSSHIAQSSYETGAAIMTTILIYRNRQRYGFDLPFLILPKGENNWQTKDKLKDYYGKVEYIQIEFANLGIKQQSLLNRAWINEAEELIREFERNESHLYLLSAYEEACEALNLTPLITKGIYNQVKLAAHRFVNYNPFIGGTTS